MDSQPSQTENMDDITKAKAKHSIIGCLSAVCGAFVIGAVLFFFYLMTSENIWGAGLDIGGMISVACMGVCAPAALILGIIGLLQKNRNRLFPAIGAGISGFLILTVVVGLIAIMIITRPDPPDTNKLPLRDNFSSEKWGTGTDTDSSIKYINDTLQFIIFKENYFVWSTPNSHDYQNVHIEVTVFNNNTESKTAFGIICNKQSNDDFYYFAITPAGEYTIAKSIAGEKDVFLTANDEWAHSDLIPQNVDSYRIGADCSNGTLTLYVNDYLIDSVTDMTYPSGTVALFVWSDEAATDQIVAFDDFLMKSKK
jgi:hypothetical protein